MTDVSAWRVVRLGSVAMLATAALLAGCTSSKPNDDEKKADVPEAAAVGPNKALPPVSGKWQGLEGDCPTLESAAAKALGADGRGRPTPKYTANGLLQQAYCAYGPADKPTVNAQVGVYPVQEAADTAWLAVSGKPNQQQLNGLGDQAFSTKEPDGSVSVHIRSKNSVIVVQVTQPGDAAATSAQAIAKDVLNDLR